MKKIPFFVIFIILSYSCSQTSQTEKELAEVLGTRLNIEMFDTIQYRDSLISMEQLRKKHSHLSVVYLQDNCTPCYPKYVEWHQKMEEIDDFSRHTVLFVIQTFEYEYFKRNVMKLEEEIDEKYYIIIDPKQEFFISNKDLPNWIMNSSMLIDSENKIKMVGSPWINEDMANLFHEIISQ
ncbi:hypothetical protein [Geofilum rubicundum]|nr:hypothetical protein [Geofilum rubicundum]